ncbi:hypothetical protein GF420_13145, partial [candidate division GN15 bacterium]|nr:hypothetical protein [candidate division GN15 bacterium]
MKSVTFTLLLMAMLLLPGCVPISIHPCYTEQSEITLPDLPGTYLDEDGEKILRFTETEAGGYNMHMLDGDEDMGTFETHFCRAGDQILIDMLPVAGSIGVVDEWAQSMILPLHLVCGVELDGAVLRLTVPDYEAMVA